MMENISYISCTVNNCSRESRFYTLPSETKWLVFLNTCPRNQSQEKELYRKMIWVVERRESHWSVMKNGVELKKKKKKSAQLFPYRLLEASIKETAVMYNFVWGWRHSVQHCPCGLIHPKWHCWSLQVVYPKWEPQNRGRSKQHFKLHYRRTRKKSDCSRLAGNFCLCTLK